MLVASFPGCLLDLEIENKASSLGRVLPPSRTVSIFFDGVSNTFLTLCLPDVTAHDRGGKPCERERLFYYYIP